MALPTAQNAVRIEQNRVSKRSLETFKMLYKCNFKAGSLRRTQLVSNVFCAARDIFGRAGDMWSTPDNTCSELFESLVSHQYRVLLLIAGGFSLGVEFGLSSVVFITFWSLSPSRNPREEECDLIVTVDCRLLLPGWWWFLTKAKQQVSLRGEH